MAPATVVWPCCRRRCLPYGAVVVPFVVAGWGRLGPGFAWDCGFPRLRGERAVGAAVWPGRLATRSQRQLFQRGVAAWQTPHEQGERQRRCSDLGARRSRHQLEAAFDDPHRTGPGRPVLLGGFGGCGAGFVRFGCWPALVGRRLASAALSWRGRLAGLALALPVAAGRQQANRFLDGDRVWPCLHFGSERHLACSATARKGGGGGGGGAPVDPPKPDDSFLSPPGLPRSFKAVGRATLLWEWRAARSPGARATRSTSVFGLERR